MGTLNSLQIAKIREKNAKSTHPNEQWPGGRKW